jgi:hypothetical protein
MTRPPDGLMRVFVIAVCAVTFLILSGYAILLFTTVSDLDRKCLKEPLANMNKCINDYYQERSSK